MSENQLVIERIKEFIKIKNLSVRAFEIKLGFSNGLFSTANKKDSSLGIDKILRICKEYKELSIKWLLTGEGEMLESTAPSQKVSASNHNINGDNHINIGEYTEKIKGLEKENEGLRERLKDKEHIISLLQNNK